jgi:DNA-binding response OmpR family regulator
MSGIPCQIVLVEDDLRLSGLIQRFLEGTGAAVTPVTHGDHAIATVRMQDPDLVILDLGLPGKDGLSICRQLRPWFRKPILVLTARGNDADQILGLELGADDYVVKPVEPRVLQARINALLRRTKALGVVPDGTMTFGRLRIDTASRSVSLAGQPVELSNGEYELLCLMASRAGEVLSRDLLFQQLYRREYDGLDRLLDVRISHLRRKLGDDARGERIKTVWGQGYLFVRAAW